MSVAYLTQDPHAEVDSLNADDKTIQQRSTMTDNEIVPAYTNANALDPGMSKTTVLKEPLEEGAYHSHAGGHFSYEERSQHPALSNAKYEAPPMPVFSNAREEPPRVPVSSNCQVEAPPVPPLSRPGNTQSRPRASRNDSYFRYD